MRGGRQAPVAWAHGVHEADAQRLKKGDAVRLSCKGGGCSSLGRKAKQVTAKKGSLDLLPYVKKLELAAKAKLTIKVSRKGYVTQSITYTMVKGKDPKKTQLG